MFDFMIGLFGIRVPEHLRHSESEETAKKIKDQRAAEANGLNIYLKRYDEEREQYYKDLKQELAANLKCL